MRKKLLVKTQSYLKHPTLLLVTSVFTILMGGCCLHCLGLTGDLYEFSNSRKTIIYACYADGHLETDGDFYALIEAQELYNQKEYEKALPYLSTIIEKNRAQAVNLQSSLKEKPWESKERIWINKELNAVGTALVIQGMVYYKLGQLEMAEASLNKQISEYPYAKCWNQKGWFIDLEGEADRILKEIHRKQKRK